MAVESWGKGKPDYYKPVISSRPVIVESESNQIQWVLNTNYTITSMGSIISTFYTVPIGYVLSLGMIDISASDSCINKLRILKDGTMISEFKFDIRGELSMTNLTGQTLSAGQKLRVYIWNNNTIEDYFSVTISGFLSKS